MSDFVSPTFRYKFIILEHTYGNDNYPKDVVLGLFRSHTFYGLYVPHTGIWL